MTSGLEARDGGVETDGSRDANEGSRWLPDDARVIALVRDRDGDAWAAGVAVGLADLVGRQRGRTFLANVAGPSDRLDRMLDADAGPGLTSALTGAATIASIARSRRDQRFAYLPAGEAALPYSALRRMRKFRRFLARVKEGGGTLLLYVGEEHLGEPAPAGSGNGAAEALQLDGCIALGDARGAAARLGAPLLARVERPAPPPAHEPGEAVPAPPPAAPGVPGVSTGERAVSRRPGSLVRLLLPVVAVLALGAAWMLLRSGSGAGEGEPADASAEVEDGSETPGEAAGAAEARVDGPTRAEAATPPAFAAPVARYSVLVGSYIRLSDAMAQRAELADDGGLFIVTPTPVRGRVYYRVLAGAYEDRSDAAAAMADLVADGRKELMKEWDIRPVHLAYDLGTFAARNDADRRARELQADRVPAYVLRDTAEAPLYRVYAGAFTSAADATPLGERLVALDGGAELITRAGVAP